VVIEYVDRVRPSATTGAMAEDSEYEMTSKGVRVKGAGVRAFLQWVSKNFGEPGVEQLIDTLPDELREPARRSLPSSWYPIVVMECLYKGIPKIAGCRDRAAIEHTLKTVSAWVAEENLSSFYKALLLIMTPDRLFEIMPRLFTTYFNGIGVTTHREAGKRGTCTVYGLGTVPFAAPGVIGWLEFAYRKVGGTVKITEVGWERGLDRSNPLVFQIDWTP
jgi:hypothetical protein